MGRPPWTIAVKRCVAIGKGQAFWRATTRYLARASQQEPLVLTAFYRFAVFRDAEAERCHAFRIRNAARA